MPTKIRLQRYGKKGNAYFHVVVVDSRKKRNGTYLEKIGSYNPNSNPATIDLDFDRALHWIKLGAQPTDTMRAMLSYKGVLYKKHLDRGVLKGVLSQEQADAKFSKWLEQKTGTIDAKRTRVSKNTSEEQKKRFEAETAVKEAKAQKVLAKKAEEAKAAEEAAKAAMAAAESAKATTAATTAAEPVAEAAPEAAPPVPVAETPKGL